MGQYKVPQNVEAEDKIIGPLTLRQFVYALIGAGWGILCFNVFKAVPGIMVVVGAPPVILFMLLAFYSRDGQNFEQLLIALVGFFANSRRRLWVKEEVVESFHVEPHKAEVEHTQRNPAEVRGELDKLATLIDSRGWNQPHAADAGLVMPATNPAERLVRPVAVPAALAQQPAVSDLPAREDMFDMQHSPLAQNLASLIEEAAADVRAEAVQQMQGVPATRGSRPAARPTAPASSISGVTAANPDDILKLATERDDLTVSQVAAAATRMAPLPESDQSGSAPR
ncbi:MAG TPA: PrgI family protein [Candidatus Saccharimonas sp.]|nr:PrgI family protein [Candidatus Saccharimonas sp.]